MSLLDNLLGANNGNMVTQLADHFGLNGGQMQGLIGQLAPALSSGFMNHAQNNQSGGLMSLLNSFQGNASVPTPSIPQDPQIEQLRDPAAVQTGNSILGQIFGSKDVSRQVADTASANTGIGSNIIKQALPVLAMWAAGALYKKFSQSNDNTPQTASNQGGMLSQFLQGDQHHSIASQVMGMLQNRT